MKPPRALPSISAALLLQASCFLAPAATSLLPGVRYYAGSQDLGGRLAFLTANPHVGRGTSNETSSIYVYDLCRQTLQKITDCPNGCLVPSRTAELFCVLSVGGQSATAHSPFLYSEPGKRSRTVHLERPPEETCLIARHAFFLMDRGTYIADFDFDTGAQTFIGGRGSTPFGYGHIAQLSQNLGAPEGRDTLHFMYREKDGTAEGPRHETGFYDLDVGSGRIEWSRQQDDPDLYFRASSGQFVYFAGPNSPLHGSKLVTSPWEDDLISSRHDPQGQLTRTLHVFPRHTVLGGAYTLECLSPDARYALVSYCRAGGAWRAFYAVNVGTGKTDLLLKDRSTLGGPGGSYPVYWLP